MTSLDKYNAKSGKLVPVRTLEIQTLADGTNNISDAFMDIFPFIFGSYQRSASI